MQPRFEILKEKKLVGLNTTMNLIQNKTGFLWSQFVPKIKEINNRVTEDKISMQIYSPEYFKVFSPTKEFEKWATVEVENFENLPSDLKTFNLVSGLYAVFDYKGSSADNSIFQYIFSEWLPKSNYALDNRPHFEVLGEKYKNNDPNSEEEIWIPVRKNNQ